MPTFDIIFYAKADEIRESINRVTYVDSIQLSIIDVTFVESELNKIPEINAVTTSYSSLNSSIIGRYEFAPSDIYLKSIEGAYTKIISKGDSIDKLRSHDLKTKYHFLYIPRNHFDLFNNASDYKLSMLIPWSSNYNLSAFQLLNQFKDKTDLSLFARKNIVHYDRYFIYSLKLIFKFKDIGPLIESYLASNRYCAWHSYSVGLIASEILTKAGLCDFETHILICLAAIIHDLENIPAFYNEVVLEVVLNNGDLDKSSDATSVLHHGENILTKLPFLQKFPAYFLETLINHHEHPGGFGYPKGKSCVGFNFFSASFIFSHAIFDQVYRILQEENPDKHNLAARLDFNHEHISAFVKCKNIFDSLKILR
jgi:hypothetical protein